MEFSLNYIELSAVQIKAFRGRLSLVGIEPRTFRSFSLRLWWLNPADMFWTAHLWAELCFMHHCTYWAWIISWINRGYNLMKIQMENQMSTWLSHQDLRGKIERSWNISQLEAIFAEFICPFMCKPLLAMLGTLYNSGKHKLMLN